MRALVVLVALSVAGCTRPQPLFDGGPDARSPDVGLDAASDDATTEDGGSAMDASTDAPPGVDASSDAPLPVDAPTDPGVPCARGGIAFGAATRIASLSETLANDDGLTISADELEAVVRRGTDREFLAFTRATTATTTWSGGLATGVNSAGDDQGPFLSRDGSALYFSSARAGGSSRLYVSARGASGTWGAPTEVTFGLFTADREDPYVTGGQLYFTTNGFGRGQAIYVVDHPGGIAIPTALANLDSNDDERAPVVSEDGLEIFFSRSGAGDGDDIWLSTRASRSGNFAPPTLVSVLRTGQNEQPEALSADGCRLYFVSNRGLGGTWDVYVATRAP